MPTREEYWEAFQARICVRCLDGSGDGHCRIAGDGFCAMKEYLPAVIEAVNSVYSHSIIPYEEQLRRHVCGSCKHQSSNGSCSLREEVDCALDRYFPLIVEVIEETQKRSHIAASR
ncbi:MAG: hypothetical protein KF749_03340 [Bacteroidetes bacterium]|nr:hypothetical protein [Bacteroidota bacterium]MCW5895525.1 hypothetical protein [Bacteroidota bacterium]